MKTKIIYSLVFPDNKRYIGQTVDIVSRLALHKTSHNAVNFYGKDKKLAPKTALADAFKRFKWSEIRLEFLCVCSAINADKREVYFMNKFDTVAPSGYNMVAERKGWRKRLLGIGYE